MRRTTLTALSAASLFAASGSLIGDGLAQSGPPFGGDEDVAFAEKLWQAMADAKLVGKDMILVQPYQGSEPHGAILETLHTTMTIDGHTGHVSVKRNYGPAELTIEDVANDPQGNLAAVTVMFQREAGYDSDHDDWYWVKYLADGSLDKNPGGMSLAGRVAKGNDEAGCIACHTSAEGDDYLFTTNLVQ